MTRFMPDQRPGRPAGSQKDATTIFLPLIKKIIFCM